MKEFCQQWHDGLAHLLESLEEDLQEFEEAKKRVSDNETLHVLDTFIRSKEGKIERMKEKIEFLDFVSKKL